MHKWQKLFISVVVGVLLLMLVKGALSQSVVTYKGINYQVSEQSLPRYLKILAFFYRHYEYQNLANHLVGQVSDHNEKIEILFKWVQQHIRPVPEGYPVIDDHIWDIIVRGYGTQDQAADVLAVLSAYSGIPAHFYMLYAPETSQGIGIAFIQRIEGGYGSFDPRADIILRHTDGRLLSIEEIREQPALVEQMTEGRVVLGGQPYSSYFKNLPQVNARTFSRTTRQMPFKRLKEMMSSNNAS
jgi:hypothetical protein